MSESTASTNTEFTIQSVATEIGALLNRNKENIAGMMDTLDGNDPAATFALEMEVAKYRAEIGIMAALVKDISDVQQMIIQKL
ncbi:MAG: hypothetical protein OXP09_10380 [Gammaproteobacteria bacterium]|nr:hypothetical protein [Gammaproteobacteria bacterium]MDE0365963.1 hypothetical protein [Gammaproteobacteria bacterium]